MIGEALIGRGIVDAMGLLSVYADWMLGVAGGDFGRTRSMHWFTLRLRK
jgi:hypothetical protein